MAVSPDFLMGFGVTGGSISGGCGLTRNYSLASGCGHLFIRLVLLCYNTACRPQTRDIAPVMFADAVARTIRQIPDPVFLKVMGLTLVLTFMALALVVYAIVVGVYRLYLDQTGLLSEVAAWAAGFMAVWAAYLIFIPVSAIFSGLFLDDVVDAVEARYYPDRPAGVRLGVLSAGWLGLRIGVYILVFNLLALPVYILTIWMPFVPVLIFYGLNSYLIGWGYYELVAIRHLGPREATRHQKNIRGTILASGLLVTALFTVPVLNLLAPVLGTAFLVHIFHATHIPPEVSS
jgi:CysZ protein